MRSSTAIVPVLMLAAAALPARSAELLPGNILASGQNQVVLFDPERRAPEVVSSASLGSGVPYPMIEDIDVATDGFVYAVDDEERLLRIDPATGDREVASSSTVGSGPAFLGLNAIEVARDGTLYVADAAFEPFSTMLRIYAVDAGTGDRTLRAERLLPGDTRINDMQELPDGRLAVAVVSSIERFDSVWIADPLTGAFTLAVTFGPIEALAPLPAGEAAYVVAPATSEDPTRVLELPFDGSAPRQIASCADAPPATELPPTGIALDPEGQLVVTAASPRLGGDVNCRLGGVRALSGQVYRLDPTSGSAVFLDEVEPFLDELLRLRSPALSDVVVVPEDFPFADRDGDGVADSFDNCPADDNSDQADLDGDGTGDACNDAEDPDGDEIADALDVCPDTPDPSQDDVDGDGIGDVCDPFPDDDNNAAAALELELARVQEELNLCLDELPMDGDGDGRADAGDRCPETPAGEEVDADGCSLDQFCAGFEPVRSFVQTSACFLADWQNDEPANPRDCRPLRGACVAR